MKRKVKSIHGDATNTSNKNWRIILYKEIELPNNNGQNEESAKKRFDKKQLCREQAATIK